MKKRTIPCRVCGKMFVPCNKPTESLGAFNYHGICCGAECGAEYLRRILASREKPVIPDALASMDNMTLEHIDAIEQIDNTAETNIVFNTEVAQVDVAPTKKDKKKEG